MTNIIHGRNLLIYSEGAAIAGAKSCEVTTEADQIEVSSPTSGVWREYKGGRKGWSVTVSTLVLSMYDTLMTSGQRVWLTMVVRTPNGLGADRLSGYAWCKNAKVNAAVGDLCKGGFTFVGDGELRRETLLLRSSEPLELRDVDEENLTVVGGIFQ